MAIVQQVTPEQYTERNLEIGRFFEKLNL